MTVTIADLNTGLEACLDRTAWLRAVLGNAYTPLHFGGVGDGVADDTTAVQDCFDAAAAASTSANQAKVYLDGKVWRMTAQLSAPHDVNVDPGKLLFDSATAHGVVFGAPPAGPHAVAVWRGVQVDHAQANTGRIVWTNGADVNVAFEDCTFNASGLCTGRLFYSTFTADVRFTECYGKIPLNAEGFRHDLGTLKIVGGRYVAPLGYADYIVAGTGGTHTLDHVHFDTSAATGGNATCVHVAGQTVIATGCHFDDGASGNGNTAFGCALATNLGDLTESGSKFRNIVAYEFTANLSPSSSVSLKPQIDINYGVGTSIDLSTLDGYRSIMLQSAAPTDPTIVLPAPLVYGQKLTLTIYNVGTTWTVTTVTGALPSGYSGVAATATKVLTFEAIDFTLSNVPAWVCVGERG